MSRKNDLVGCKYGRLTVERDGGRDPKKNIRWLCVCVCGGAILASASDLKRGKVASCGCLRKELVANKTRTHGLSKTRTYRIWSNMITRCTNERRRTWSRYGGRGVHVDPRWFDYTNFLCDMGEAPSGLSLDRINNDGGYEKANCRWATRAQQASNTSRTVKFALFGTTITQSEAAKKYNISRHTLCAWRKAGMTDKQIEEKLLWRQHRKDESKRPW